jgi:AcrR family transcriptional regulator
MPNKRAVGVRKQSSVDARVERSTRALATALVELMAEHDYDDITVQQVLDRCGVGRATFYAHFRNKADILHSSYDSVLTWFGAQLEATSDGGRLFPVREFLDHLVAQGPLVESLRRSGQLTAMRDALHGHVARTVEQRLASVPGDFDRRLLAQMLAGALVEAVQWWDSHREQHSPAQVDRAFHTLVHRWLTGIQR